MCRYENDLSDVEEAERKDDVIDSLVSSWREAQIQALKQQKCSSEVSMMLSRILQILSVLMTMR